jgi:hypothetical protein
LNAPSLFFLKFLSIARRHQGRLSTIPLLKFSGLLSSFI